MKKHLFDVLLGSVLTFFSCGLLAYYFWPTGSDTVLLAYIYKEAKLVQNPIDLSKETVERTFIIDVTEGEMTLGVKHNGIAVLKSPCANQFCVRTGYISRPSQSIICAPNELFITIEGVSQSEIWLG
jgi:hypothetical protein